MNLAETAFLRPGAHGYRLRRFTRAVEVDLRGRLQLAGQAVTVPRGELLD